MCKSHSISTRDFTVILTLFRYVAWGANSHFLKKRAQVKPVNPTKEQEIEGHKVEPRPECKNWPCMGQLIFTIVTNHYCPPCTLTHTSIQRVAVERDKHLHVFTPMRPTWHKQ